MGEEADADWEAGLLEWVKLETLINRRDFLFRNAPRCVACGDFQVQLIAQHEPAHWKCRVCKHRFSHDQGSNPSCVAYPNPA